MRTLATPSTCPHGSFTARNPGGKPIFGCPANGDIATAAEARRVQLLGWSRLDLRQHFADEAWMRSHIKAAGLRAPATTEPATVTRLRSFLKRAGIAGQDIVDSLGITLAGYLKLNPMLPLWAALGLILEATGRFTAQAFNGLPQGESK